MPRLPLALTLLAGSCVAAFFLSAAPAAGAAAPASMFPAAGASAVPPDTQLRLEFSGTPTLGAPGAVRVYDAATRQLVAAVPVPGAPANESIGGIPNFKYLPVLILGHEVRIALHPHALGYGRAYYVTVDPGLFRSDGAASAGWDERNPWRFTTRALPPPAGAAQLVVAADGTGDFCTVEGALDWVPEHARTRTTLVLRPGTYTEIVAFAHKSGVTLRGDDRHACVIAYPNNARFNDGGGNPYAAGPAAGPKPRSIYHRGVFLAEACDDLVLENLTIRNLTPQGGSQAEALILDGTEQARATLRDVDLFSYQDTLQVNGQAYLARCFIAGDVDFLWGKGPCFFTDCTFRAVRSDAYYTQVRNPDTHHGFVFEDCTFTGAPGVTGNYLARIEPNRFPASEVVLLHCVLGESVGAAGWQLQGAPRGTPAPATMHFWEFASRTPAGAPVSGTGRLPGSRQLDQGEDAALIARYSDPQFVLGAGGTPPAADPVPGP